jgi:Tol biopolymer transport system component/DNA-binding winged helix-turn-helix (wHTH) protein
MSEVPPSVPGLVRFGSFELDARSGELRKAGVRVGLQEQPLQVLILLLARPGQLVTREELRQRLWPSNTFVDFDHGLNAVINRLRDTLGDSADTPRFVETLPRRGYRFIAPVEGNRPTDQSGPNEATVQADVQPIDIPPATASDTSEPRRSRGWFSTGRAARRAGIAALSAIVLIVVGIGAWRLRPAPAVAASPRVVPLTTLKGWEGHPSFSPDGTQIAFTWSGGKGDNPWDGSTWDTYVKIIGSSEIRRVTTSHPGWNFNPAWSPDGRHIAFVRCEKGRCQVYLTSPLGGSELKVSDLPISYPGIAWSPDSQFIAAGRSSRHGGSGAAGIYLMPAQGGEPRAITRAPAGAFHRAPAFSPDGHHMAYVSCVIDAGWGTGCDVFSVDLDASFTPVGAARRLTTETIASIQGVTWTRDGRSLLYDTEAVPFVNYIWRVAADGTRPPERVELAGFGSSIPATVPSQDRLAFLRSWYNEDVYQSTAGHPPQPLVSSSFPESNPQFSPDGHHVVFCSPRSGDAVEIWVADADGSSEHQLLHGPNRMQRAPHWSPDGRFIAFDSLGADGHWHVWIIDAEGGQPHQVVVDAGDQKAPTWSHDGHWIYFWSEQNIWRVPATGGRREQLTQGGAWDFAGESTDGKNLLYQSAKEKGGALMTVPLTGGQARQLVPCVSETAFIAGAKGIYYVACDAGPDPLVQLLNPTTGETRALMRLSRIEYRMPPYGLAVSPDGGTVLYARLGSAGDDLMLIENFH